MTGIFVRRGPWGVIHASWPEVARADRASKRSTNCPAALASAMKIVDVKTYVLEARLAEPFAYSQAWYETRGACLVEIVGEDGNSGWGEAFGPARLTAPIVEYYKPLLIGEDALATERHWQTLYNRLRDHGQKGLAIEALSRGRHRAVGFEGRAISACRWHGCSAARCATGSRPTRPGSTASAAVTRSPIWSKRRRSGSRKALPAIKLKLGFGMEDDIRLCHAVRRAVGDRLSIMIDANHAYDALGAIALGRRIEEFDIAWFEEPVPPEDLAGYREVKAALKIPIAGGEAEFTRWGFRPLIADRWSTSCSPTSPRPAASPKQKRSPTWRMPSACGSIRMSGAPRWRSPPRCS